MKLSRLKNDYLLTFIGGIIFSFAILYPLQLNPVAFFAPHLGLLIYFFISEKKQNQNPKKISILFFLFSFAVFLRAFYWLTFTIKEFGFIPVPFNLILATIFVPFLFPYLWVGQMLQFLARKKWPTLNSWLKIVLFSGLMVLAEELTPQQFPAHLGHFWLNLAPYVFGAPYWGAIGYSLISYLVIFSILNLLQKRTKSVQIALTLFAVFFFSHFFFPLKNTYNKKEELHLRIVQGNIGNYLKLNSEKGDELSLLEVIERYKRLSLINVHPGDLDLIIWPETAFPYTLYSPQLKKHPYLTPQLINQVMQSSSADLVTGGYDQSKPFLGADDYFETVYNTVFHFNKDKGLVEAYHKHRLIPFGETLPFGPITPILSRYIQNVSYFARGDNFAQFYYAKKNIRFSSAICYEILFPHFIQEMLNSSPQPLHFLINLTNDSWYGDTAEPHQHLFLAKWRALEFNLPIVRSTNTGITSVIYPNGSESSQSKINQETYLDVNLAIDTLRQDTWYQRYGILTVSLFFGLILILALILV